MLKARECSIYPNRPSTCRTFDCRVLAATGLSMEGKWSERINARVQAWQFRFSSEGGQQRIKAMRETAIFLQQHAAAFPGGLAPTEPLTIAVLAIKVHSVLLTDHYSNPQKIANAIVIASRRFNNEANGCCPITG